MAHNTLVLLDFWELLQLIIKICFDKLISRRNKFEIIYLRKNLATNVCTALNFKVHMAQFNLDKFKEHIHICIPPGSP